MLLFAVFSHELDKLLCVEAMAGVLPVYEPGLGDGELVDAGILKLSSRIRNTGL